MNADRALLRLAGSTSDSIAAVLEMIAPGAATRGAVSVAVDAAVALADVPLPAVVADVPYVDGVTGGNLLAVSSAGAHRLAATMMGADPGSDGDAPEGGLGEIELSAIGEAMNQMMSAAAQATSGVLGEEVEIAPPVVREVTSMDDVVGRGDSAAHACVLRFTIFGAPCVIVQLVPHAFVMRMTRALDELTTEYESAPLGDGLREVAVRVWAELGRAQMPSARAASLPGGSVVELDHGVGDPVDLYADGMRFATGRLLVGPDGGVVVRIDSLLGAVGDPASQPIKEVA